ncbi:hypothetical protein CEXT_27421 [Caerostris extrusa]|uniref:Uncharacterized protein n=1 Tax=Caerostris extrusa TaxID=172846 RepID=A0AAV4SUD4_CAEEX|nr:hypothetical protein CEXT_27421 [Caerostris extrusa]
MLFRILKGVLSCSFQMNGCSKSIFFVVLAESRLFKALNILIVSIAFVFGCILAVSLSSPIASEEGSSLVQEQAQADYKQHQTTIDKQGHSSSLSNPEYNTNGFTF